MLWITQPHHRWDYPSRGMTNWGSGYAYPVGTAKPPAGFGIATTRASRGNGSKAFEVKIQLGSGLMVEPSLLSYRSYTSTHGEIFYWCRTRLASYLSEVTKKWIQADTPPFGSRSEIEFAGTFESSQEIFRVDENIFRRTSVPRWRTLSRTETEARRNS